MENIMDIYIITSGSYSDYSINAVYLDRALAQQKVELMKLAGYSDVEAEQWPVDTTLPQIVHVASLQHPWVHLGERQRPVPNYNADPVVVALRPQLHDSDKLPRTHITSHPLGDGKARYAGVGYGRTPEHAEKSLWDALAQHKAEQAGL